jgi:NADP-dependent 3-hydroxy acid dehydrogenase YdfG
MDQTNPGVALLTGTSTGIGNATAKACYRVFGTTRRTADARSGGVTMLTCDVTDEASVAKLVDDVLAEAGRLDLLVNNAGLGLLGGAEESSIDQAKALFEVNVFGVLRVTNAVLPTMCRQGKGRIVNLARCRGSFPRPTSRSIHRPSTPSKGIPSRSIMNCVRSEFVSPWSSPPIPPRPSKKTSPSRTSFWRCTPPRAPELSRW